MNAEASRTLDSLRFPLHGSRLIEASAGTGKTFTIAALYVRLVLGHGGDAAFARALTPPEILVVTFTEAATQELRERIRARLAEAAAYFRVAPDEVQACAPGPDLLHDLRNDYPAQEWPGCARKLQLASEWMDEAAVSTIHAWCNRMLREHAFDSGSLFTQTLETDQSELLAEVVRDYWRTFHYPLDAEAAQQVAAWWQSPEALRKALRSLLDHAEALDPAPPPDEALRAAEQACAHRLAELKAPWGEWVDEVERLLDQAVAAKHVVGSKLQRRYYATWLGALRDWCTDPTRLKPALEDGSKAWERLTPEGLAEAWKVGDPPDHPLLQAIPTLRDELACLPDARADILRFAARWIAERFAAEQAQRAQMGFNDLLTHLDEALGGPNGERLAELIRTQFPVALIDEFQDTDPVQYRIFDAVYGVADNRGDAALLLIGDPKQAIYGFRGADVHTYLDARRATRGRLYTLDKNFRSTAAMVDAVNHCFARAEERADGEGAFLFRGAGDNPVPFHRVSACGRDEALVIADAPVPALNAWWREAGASGEAMNKGDARETIAAVFATEITRLLALGQQGQAGFAAPERPLRPLTPSDVAVLVNDGRDAAAIRRELAARGVRSVYLSDRESVFEAPQAAELQVWLAACAEPDDERLLRAALATPTLALDWETLDTLMRDELAWEARVLQFRGYRQCWREQGVLPMLRRVLADHGAPARLLQSSDGERALTDLLHLAELLQQASVALEGEHALVRHLAELRDDGGGNDEGRKLRLESDADLVQVVTVHKSKGLEYPLVFLPFASAFRAVRADAVPLQWHDDAGRLHLTLTPDADQCAQADRERLGEDLRKLYVALTRARHAVWLGAAPIDALHRSALGYLLAGGKEIAPDELGAVLDELQSGCTAITVAPAPAATPTRLAPPVAVHAPGPAREPLRKVREHWWVASYSALKTAAAAQDGHTTASRGSLGSAADTAIEDVFAETLGEAASPARLRADANGEASLHGFPRGAVPGTFLHEVLEWAADFGFANVADSVDVVHAEVGRRCKARGWESWTDALCAWLREYVSMPICLPSAAGGGAGEEVTLARLSGFRPELEFWVEARDVDALRLDALVQTHTLAARPRPVVLPTQLNGMLKGFIDLVFEYRGRYYVADYKSNWLGADDDAYSHDAMRDVVLEKRYDLQYTLYLFALHRLLGARLPDYDYERDVGGAVYLFLRGNRAATRGVHFERPPYALIAALDDLFRHVEATGAPT